MIYGELRQVARRYLARERQNHTLQPTALVHEAWLKLQNERGEEWQGRTHGSRSARRRCAGCSSITAGIRSARSAAGALSRSRSTICSKRRQTGAVPVEDLLTLEDALTRLEAIDARAAQVVTLRFFSGMSNPEVARALGPVAAHGRRRLDARARVAQTRAVWASLAHSGRHRFEPMMARAHKRMVKVRDRAERRLCGELALQPLSLRHATRRSEIAVQRIDLPGSAAISVIPES